MNRVFLTLLLIIPSLTLTTITAQTLGVDIYDLGDDNANNYSGNWEVTNQGSGFSDWTFDQATPNDGFAGRFIGSFSEALDVNNEAFALYANGGDNATSGAKAAFPKTMDEGDSFTVSIGINFRDGAKGFDLRDASNNTIINFNVGNDEYKLNGSTTLFNNTYDANTVITFTFMQNSDTISWTAVRSGGLTDSASGTLSDINSGTINNIRFYNVSAGTNNDGGNGERNLFFNSLAFNSLYTIAGNSAVTSSGDTTVPYLTIESGSTLTIPASSSVVVSGNLNNSGDLTLNSTSSAYASLIVNGVATGTATYNRYANVEGSGESGSGGNDLISFPLVPSDGITFDTFLGFGSPENSTKIPNNGSVYGFGPYENSTQNFVNFPLSSTESLIEGKGYRTATSGGTNLVFTGDVETNTVPITITTPIDGNQWNLIGNPFPSYISAMDFLNSNSEVLDPAATAIYGYNSATYSGTGETVGNFTIINELSNTDLNIAPGQGFFVAAMDTPNFSDTVNFTTNTRTTTGADDFIEGRTTTTNYRLKLNLIGASTYSTSFYFNSNSTLSLDAGYDAAVFGGIEEASTYPLYSHLVENNAGRAFAIQSLNENALNDVIIPLGVHSNQGEQLTFTIDSYNLPTGIEVYLEDNETNSSTLLNLSDYILTPSTTLNGTGRFFLRFSNTVLSTPQNSIANLNVFTNYTDKTINIQGELSSPTNARVYDIQGRLVVSQLLNVRNNKQSINVSKLSTGIYIVKLENGTLNEARKVILK